MGATRATAATAASPEQAFPIGKQAVLLGTEVEVLGWARWRTRDGWTYYEVTLRTADAERWTLELDEGHILLFREMTVGPLPDPLAPAPGSVVQLDRRRHAFPASRVRLERAGGEYWKDLEPGDQLDDRSFYAAPTVLNASREVGEDDWEWSQGVYLDPAEVEAAFGVELPRPTEPHAARPYPFRPWLRLLPWAALVSGVAGLIAALFLGSGSAGAPLLTGKVQIPAAIGQAGPVGEAYVGIFDSDEPQVVGLRVRALGLRQDWLYVDATLGPVPPEDANPETFEPEVLGQLGTEFGYYEGADSDGAWTESHTATSDGFRIGAGTYMVMLAWEREPTAGAPLAVEAFVVPGYRDRTVLLVWSGLCLVGFVIFAVLRRKAWFMVLVDAGLREEPDDDD